MIVGLLPMIFLETQKCQDKTNYIYETDSYGKKILMRENKNKVKEDFRKFLYKYMLKDLSISIPVDTSNANKPFQPREDSILNLCESDTDNDMNHGQSRKKIKRN